MLEVYPRQVLIWWWHVSNDSSLSLGLGVIFDKLQQGCYENDEVLGLATARAEAEKAYGNNLLEIRRTHASKKEGFARDEGMTVRNAYEGILKEMGEEGKHHVQVSERIQVMVLTPFKKWSDEHKTRVDYSSDFLRNKIKAYEQEGNEVQKIQRKYFNKCRVLDEALQAEENGEEQTEDGAKTAASSPPKLVTSPEPPKPIARVDSVVAEEEKNEPVELAGVVYTQPELQELLVRLLNEVPQHNVKVPIMGTYDHVSTGADVVSWLVKNKTGNELGTAEAIGQDLVQNGFLRLIGQVGNKFLNSSQLNYQWKKIAYIRANMLKDDQKDQAFAPSFVGEYISGTINNYLNNPHPDETNLQRLKREVAEMDAKYKDAVIKYDDARCLLEESIIDHLVFMEKCEKDRLNAVKQVFLDFVAPISNALPAIQATVDKFLIYQETIKPERDLLYLVESYKTGGFSPKVPVYDNYYSTAEGWTFGVDLEFRSRGDGKRIPLIISSILGYMDNQYPIMENDSIRLGIWSQNVPLKKIHELRKLLNNGQPVQPKDLEKFDPAVVAGVLKLYLRELPESIVPSNLYDAVKIIYTSPTAKNKDARVQQIKSLCSSLRISQIAALDALAKHFGRLIEIAQPSEQEKNKLADALGPSILKPMTQTAVTLGDKHPALLFKDLIDFGPSILTEIKRNASGARSRNASRKNSRRMASQAVDASSTAAPENSSEDVPLYQKTTVGISPPSSLNAQSLKVRTPHEPVELKEASVDEDNTDSVAAIETESSSPKQDDNTEGSTPALSETESAPAASNPTDLNTTEENSAPVTA